MTTVHFYLTHGIASRYYGSYNPEKKHYWRAVSWGYVPLILSFWAGYILDDEGADNFDFSSLAWPVPGELAGFILFSALIIKTVKMDLDLVLAPGFIIAVVGTLTGGAILYLF